MLQLLQAARHQYSAQLYLPLYSASYLHLIVLWPYLRFSESGPPIPLITSPPVASSLSTDSPPLVGSVSPDQQSKMSDQSDMSPHFHSVLNACISCASIGLPVSNGGSTLLFAPPLDCSILCCFCTFISNTHVCTSGSNLPLVIGTIPLVLLDNNPSAGLEAIAIVTCSSTQAEPGMGLCCSSKAVSNLHSRFSLASNISVISKKSMK